MSKITYTFRLYPTRQQQRRLQETLECCRELYNAALQERRDAYRMCNLSIMYTEQANQLPEIKQIREEYQAVHSQVLQDILRRVDKTFQRFFGRCIGGKTPGYPRFKGKGCYESFTYPQSGFSITQDHRVCLSKIGSIKMKQHRQLQGTIKTCAVKREGEAWYIIFTCERAMMRLPESKEQVGIDLGVLHLATLSTGETIEHPHFYRKAEKKLQALQQSLSKKKRSSNRRKKAVKRLALQHRKVRNQRRDFLHKASCKLVSQFQMIVFEEIETANLTKRPLPKQGEHGDYLPIGASMKGGLNKSILDAGWHEFVQYVSYKAANAGRTILRVSPRYTSQMCSSCGTVVKKALSERWHSCACGCELDRDHNAAINILRLGRSRQAQA